MEKSNKTSAPWIGKLKAIWKDVEKSRLYETQFKEPSSSVTIGTKVRVYGHNLTLKDL